MSLENIDLTTLSSEELAELQRMAARERAERQESSEITQAATNLITTAKNLGYSRGVVMKQLNSLIDDIYEHTAPAE